MSRLPPPGSQTAKRPELLAPAGSPDAGYAALGYGADAVYLGLKRFSARAEAANFSLEELDSLTAYAHSLSPTRRVYVTVNTLVLESEVPELVATLAALRDLDVDAVVVQDLGVARIVRRHFPELELHASTQMAVHSLGGVEALARLGVRRAVTARELTLDELRAMCGQTDVEIECFIHGALCYSYSGLCLFSSHVTGRSANRGRCAYVCGGSFSTEAASARPSSALPFAMKDLALPHRLSDLAAAGVASFKIEGRKKSPLYVAAVTDFYRGILDGDLDEAKRAQKEADLRTVFSRPWTELYLASPRQNASGEPSHVGHRGAPVGTVSAVRGSRREGTILQLASSRPLEVHDGLQVEIPGLVKPYGFSIERLRPAGAAGWGFEAGPGNVEVALPPEHPAIPLGAAVHCASSQAVKRAFRWTTPRKGQFRRRRPLAVTARVSADRVDLSARLQLGGPSVPALEAAQTLHGGFGPARDPGAAADGARAAFERLGNTPFVLGQLSVENDEALFVAPSQWNQLRRTVAEALERAVGEARDRAVRETLTEAAREAELLGQAGPEGGPEWSVKTDRIEELEGFGPEDWQAAAEVVVVLRGASEDFAEKLLRLADRIGRRRIRLALPAVLRPWDEGRLLPQVSRLLADGWKNWEVANLAGWGHLGLTLGRAPADSGLDLAADWPLYALNSAAARELLDLGVSSFALSPEDGAENLKSLLKTFGGRATVIVYQITPLFLSETCPQATLAGNCPGPARCTFEELDLLSDFGNRVRALNRNCRTVVVSRSPLCLSSAAGELAAAGASRFRVDLQYREPSPAEARDIWRAVRAGRAIEGSHQGNYRRGLL